MLDVAIGTLTLFFILSLIGIGPALLLSKRSFTLCLTISPVIGLILTTLVGTYLVRLNYPISSWALHWSTFAISVSLLCFWFMRQKISLINKNNFDVSIFFLGLVITTLLVLAPMIIGGLTFTVLRGNGVDAFNYITMAGFLQHEPFAWASSATTQALADKHPTYILAKALLTTRWSTSVILGWGSSLLHIPLQRFEYGFTTLFFMITYCCAFSIGLRLSMRKSYILLLAVAISVGFWAQFVLDIRAMSQISVLPVFMFFIFLLLHTEEEKNVPYSQQILMGITIAAIAFLYIELLPLMALGLLLFFTLQLITKQDTLTRLIKKYGLAGILSLLILIPIAHTYLLQFFASQMTTAIHSKNNWDQMYFHWLYKRPLIGLWGLSYLEAIPFVITKIFFSALAIILSAIFFWGTLYSTIKWKKNSSFTNICLSFLFATFLEFIYLYSKGQLWAAGKAISFAYPFLFFLIASFGLTSYSHLIKRKYLISISTYSVLVWLVIQCGLGLYRIEIARTQTDYPRYSAYHSQYRQHDWNIQALTSFIDQKKPQSVRLLLPDTWLMEYLSFAWGWNTKILLDGIKSREGNLIIKQNTYPAPLYLVVPFDHPYLKKSPILAHNTELALIETPRSYSLY